MDNENEKNLQTAENTAEAGKDENVAAELGKFGSVDALLNAYRALEAEFTRRSQRLSELEKGNKAQEMPCGAPSRESISKEELLQAALANEEVRCAVIGDYLKGVAANKSVPIISGGVSPACPRTVPKSVKEAGALAQSFLKNN